MMETQLTVDKRYYVSSYLKALRSIGFRLGWIQGLGLSSLSVPLLSVFILEGSFPLTLNEEFTSSSRLIFQPATVMGTGMCLLLW